MRRAGLTVAIAALVAAIGAPAGGAAASPQFDVIEGGGALFPDRAYVVTLPSRKDLTSDDVTVTEDGKPIGNLVVQSAASAGGIGTVLLIDASNSMQDSIGAAMAAARTFATRNPGQPLSVVFFSTRPRIALGFSTDRKQIAAVLSRNPKLTEGTRIHDALAAAVAQIRGSGLGAARIVLLSDGDDVGSVTSLDSALSQLAAERVRVFTVGIESSDFSSTGLERIADTTGGAYAAATTASSLTPIYGQLGFRLGNEYLLRYDSLARPDEQVEVAVSIDGFATPVSFTYTTPATGTGGPYQRSFMADLLQSWVLLAVVIVLIAGLVFLAVETLLNLRGNRRLRVRLGEFVTMPEEQRAAERRRQVDQLLAAVGDNKQRRRNWRLVEGYAEDADVGRIEHDPKLLLWLAIGAGLLIAPLAGAAVRPFWAVFGLVPLLVLNVFIRGRARKVRDEYGDQLPENLDVLASALRAGHSLAGALGVVADEAAEPSRSEFTRVVNDEQLGIPLDEALEVTAKRMQNPDTDQVAVLALLQREAGGNTAEVLDQVIANIRERMDLRRLVRVQTAQGRFSSWVVSGIPVAIVAFIALISPDYLDPLLHTSGGQVAALLAVACVVAGFFVIRRIVAIEL